jgi:diguanylate cyclase (GGDEF)-like protein
LLDIDHFKGFNDRFGHLSGDECLKQVASCIQSSVGRSADEVARYGGEEFALILPDTDLEGAAHVAETIRRDIELTSLQVDGVAHQVTVSVGAACIHHFSGLHPADLIAAADAALYEAKLAGRNRVMRMIAGEMQAGVHSNLSRREH